MTPCLQSSLDGMCYAADAKSVLEIDWLPVHALANEVLFFFSANEGSHQLGQAPPHWQTFFDASAGRPKGSKVQ
jgi:hypothetical protein